MDATTLHQRHTSLLLDVADAIDQLKRNIDAIRDELDSCDSLSAELSDKLNGLETAIINLKHEIN